MNNYKPRDYSKLNDTKVLVVEDSADTRDLICLALRKAGAIVETAEDGQEGLDKALKSKPDIMLLDLELPEISGFGVIKQLRNKHDYHKPILAITSHNTIQDRDRCSEAGFNGYIMKPFDQDRLIEVLNLHLPHNP